MPISTFIVNHSPHLILYNLCSQDIIKWDENKKRQCECYLFLYVTTFEHHIWLFYILYQALRLCV